MVKEKEEIRRQIQEKEERLKVIKEKKRKWESRSDKGASMIGGERNNANEKN